MNIVVDQATFEAALAGAVTDQPVDTPASANPTRRRCETLDGILLDPLDVITAAVVGHVRRVVIDSAGTVIDLGRKSRLFTGSSRLAAWLQGIRCIWPGCGFHHCQIDHTTEWHDRGVTRPGNAGPLCPWHNRWKHPATAPGATPPAYGTSTDPTAPRSRPPESTRRPARSADRPTAGGR